jgi:hypothetical protein
VPSSSSSAQSVRLRGFVSRCARVGCEDLEVLIERCGRGAGKGCRMLTLLVVTCWRCLLVFVGGVGDRGGVCGEVRGGS